MKKNIPSVIAIGITVGGIAVSSPAMAHQHGAVQPPRALHRQVSQADATTKSKHGAWNHLPFPNESLIESQAKLLGITAVDLKAHLDHGKTFLQIAADLGITLEQLNERRLAEMKVRIEALVVSGKINQAEADRRIARLATPHLHRFQIHGFLKKLKKK